MMLRALSIFAGIGGFDLACEWAGFEIVGQVENEPYCIAVLEKHWPKVKRLTDIHDVKGDEFGSIDLLCGGPPCQPASQAGKRGGSSDDRWLWPQALRILRQAHPAWAIFENPTGILTLNGGLEFERVLLEMEAQGYTVQPVVLPACAVDAKHRRDRVWIVGHHDGAGRERPRTVSNEPNAGTDGREHVGGPGENVADAEECPTFNDAPKQDRRPAAESSYSGAKFFGNGGRETSRWLPEPEFCGVAVRLPEGLDGSENFYSYQEEWEGVPRVATGVKNRVDRLKGLGNSIQPQVAYELLRTIADLEKSKIR